jgi:TetR/AcrR family transcriptional regulator
VALEFFPLTKTGSAVISKYILTMGKVMAPTGNRLSADERRILILEAALNVFARKGYSGARTKEIAREAGISETLVFRHFDTKENLYQEALEHLYSHHPVFDDMEPAMAANDDRQVLYVLALHVMEHGRRDERIVRLNLYGGLEGINTASDELEPMLILEKYLERRMEEGALRKTDPHLAARFFLYTVFFYMSEIHLKLAGPPLEMSDEGVAAAMVDLYMQGLLPRE